MEHTAFLLGIVTVFFLACQKDQTPDDSTFTSGESIYYGLVMDDHPKQPGLTFLPVNTYQQTTDHTCAASSIVTLLRFYGRSGDEMTIASELTTGTAGTTPEKMTFWLNNHGFTAKWHQLGTLDTLRNRLAQNKPTVVEWSDWGGHWVLCIGYDTRNTPDPLDDVILFADPFDRIDDHPDGVT